MGLEFAHNPQNRYIFAAYGPIECLLIVCLIHDSSRCRSFC